MQRGYWYVRTEPAGRNFAAGFRPELTPAQMLRQGARLRAELFRRRRQPAAVGVAQEGVDLSRRPPRLVSMVLPLLHGPAHSRRGRAADQALESHPPPHSSDSEKLRTGRCHLPAAATSGAAALGLRQPEDLGGLQTFRLDHVFGGGRGEEFDCGAARIGMAGTGRYPGGEHGGALNIRG